MRTLNRGFSLLELMIVVATLSIVFGLSFVALKSAVQSSAVAQAKSDALAEVRDIVMAMAGELQYARKNDPQETPTVLVVTYRGVTPSNGSSPPLPPGSPTEIVFQVPVDGEGDDLSGRIRYRYINEDANSNHLLDHDEDTLVADGVLTRRIVRIEDVTDPASGAVEQVERMVGGANDITDLSFTLGPSGNNLTIAATATKVIPGTLSHDKATDEVSVQTVSASLTSRVYFVN